MGDDHMTTEIILSPSRELQPAPLFTPTPKAAKRVLEFFTAQINNDHTRKAYLNATRRFAQWCDEKGIRQLADVQAFHVAAFVKELQGEFTAPTVKQHLAALRMLFDWLVTGHVLETNPAHAVRGPKYVVKKGKTPVLNTGVLPFFTTYLGPRTAWAGFVSRTWPVTSQSKSIRSAARCCFTVGAVNSPCSSLTKAATWKACTSASWRMPFSSHHWAKRRVAFRYALRVWSLLIWAVKNSSTRLAAFRDRERVM